MQHIVHQPSNSTTLWCLVVAYQVLTNENIVLMNWAIIEIIVNCLKGLQIFPVTELLKAKQTKTMTSVNK